MRTQLLSEWKKVDLRDLPSVVQEIKAAIKIPSVLVLSGDMGIGKTTFSQHFIGKIQQSVVSPTYAIVNDHGDTLHADLYRLEEPGELLHLELHLYTAGKRYLLLEWGESFIGHLVKELGHEFFYFELRMKMHPGSDLRDYELFSIITDE
jgi:tRNA threonylcarbamoyladenosine biosynthesis protein TsaE